MRPWLAAVSLFVAFASPAGAQTVQRLPGMLCIDGTDPRVTGIACNPTVLRNAIDEGKVSTTLPRTVIVVPNDPLGNNTGNLQPQVDQFSTFGNRGVQLQKIR